MRRAVAAAILLVLVASCGASPSRWLRERAGGQGGIPGQVVADPAFVIIEMAQPELPSTIYYTATQVQTANENELDIGSAASLDSLAAMDVVQFHMALFDDDTQPQYTDIVAGLRARNPDIIVLDYLYVWGAEDQWVTDPSWGPGNIRYDYWQFIDSHDYWLRDTAGNRVADDTGGGEPYLVNIGLSEARADSFAAFFADYVNGSANSQQYTGVYLDYFMWWDYPDYPCTEGCRSIVDYDEDGIAYSSDVADERVAYQNGIVWFLTKLREKINHDKFLIIANGTGHHEAGNQICALTDGGMYEIIDDGYYLTTTSRWNDVFNTWPEQFSTAVLPRPLTLFDAIGVEGDEEPHLIAAALAARGAPALSKRHNWVRRFWTLEDSDLGRIDLGQPVPGGLSYTEGDTIYTQYELGYVRFFPDTAGPYYFDHEYVVVDTVTGAPDTLLISDGWPRQEPPSEEPTIPDAPSGLAVTYNGDYITFAWDNSGDPDHDHFEVWRGPYPGGETYLADAGGNSYTDNAVSVGSYYYYAVRDIDVDGDGSDPSTSLLVTVSGTAPAVPTGLAVTDSTEQVALAWDASTDDRHASYAVYRGASAASMLLQGTVTATSYTDASVAVGESWVYAIRDLDTDGLTSDQSDVVGVTVQALPSEPLPTSDGFIGTREDTESANSWMGGGYFHSVFTAVPGEVQHFYVRRRVTWHDVSIMAPAIWDSNGVLVGQVSDCDTTEVAPNIFRYSLDDPITLTAGDYWLGFYSGDNDWSMGMAAGGAVFRENPGSTGCRAGLLTDIGAGASWGNGSDANSLMMWLSNDPDEFAPATPGVAWTGYTAISDTSTYVAEGDVDNYVIDSYRETVIDFQNVDNQRTVIGYANGSSGYSDSGDFSSGAWYTWYPIMSFGSSDSLFGAVVDSAKLCLTNSNSTADWSFIVSVENPLLHEWLDYEENFNTTFSLASVADGVAWSSSLSSIGSYSALGDTVWRTDLGQFTDRDVHYEVDVTQGVRNLQDNGYPLMFLFGSAASNGGYDTWSFHGGWPQLQGRRPVLKIWSHDPSEQASAGPAWTGQVVWSNGSTAASLPSTIDHHETADQAQAILSLNTGDSSTPSGSWGWNTYSTDSPVFSASYQPPPTRFDLGQVAFDRNVALFNFGQSDSVAGGTVESATLNFRAGNHIYGADSLYVWAANADLFDEWAAAGESDDLCWDYSDASGLVAWSQALDTLIEGDLGARSSTYIGDIIANEWYSVDVTDALQSAIDGGGGNIVFLITGTLPSGAGESASLSIGMYGLDEGTAVRIFLEATINEPEQASLEQSNFYWTPPVTGGPVDAYTVEVASWPTDGGDTTYTTAEAVPDTFYEVTKDASETVIVRVRAENEHGVGPFSLWSLEW